MSEAYRRCRILAEICVKKGVTQAVLSSGSRNAPLALALARHPKIQTRSIIDERAAGFFALGLAQALNQPVILNCTSGTAALNYGPAVAEACYSGTPLIVLTADRPPEWIDQRDGQAIHQENSYGSHLRFAATLPAETRLKDEHWHWNRLVNEALNASRFPDPGPVHLNVPFREPFYPEPGGEGKISAPRIIEEDHPAPVPDETIGKALAGALTSSRKIVFMAGQSIPDPSLAGLVEKISVDYHIPVIADHLSNLGSLTNRIWSQDILSLDSETIRDLQPDLILSWGRSLLSRSWKEAVRGMPRVSLWQIQEAGPVADTFQSLEKIIRVSPKRFFRHGFALGAEPRNPQYLEAWKGAQGKIKDFQTRLLDQPGFVMTEPWIVREILRQLPSGVGLHLGNSLPVRWANYFPPPENGVKFWSNRGTSGIDGTVSTAVGHAAAGDALQVFMVGDLALQYDHSLLLERALPGNLRMIVLNNGGGGIFGVIDGPRRQPDFEPVFRTPRSHSFQELGKLAEMKTLISRRPEEFQRDLKRFLTPGKQAVLWEVRTDWERNQDFIQELKKWNRK